MKSYNDRLTKGGTTVRTLLTVQDDGLWPDDEPDLDPTKDRRRQALAHVLCRIPEDDYRCLAEAIDDFAWFIPPAWKRASCELFPATWGESPLAEGARGIRGARVLYLSPTLERTAEDVLTAIIAHELAHIVLKHSMTPGKKYQQQEDEADRLVCRWGFEHEHRRHIANKRRRGLI